MDETIDKIMEDVISRVKYYGYDDQNTILTEVSIRLQERASEALMKNYELNNEEYE